MWIVRVALNRPYTFVVLALLILGVGPLTIARTPTDIFPNIDIPVVAVIWNYGGLSAQEMADRIISNFERSLTTAVNDIEHIESQSLRGISVVKVFLQPGAKIDLAVAQTTAVSQAMLRQAPVGTTPPFILTYNASSVPIIQLALSGQRPVGAAAVRPRRQLHPPAAGDGIGRGDSLAVRRQAAADSGGPRSRGAAGRRPRAGRRGQRDHPAEPDPAVRHLEDRIVRIRRRPQRQPANRRRAERPADQDGRLDADLHPRRRARAQRLSAADQHRPRRRPARGADGDSEDRQRLDARRDRERQGRRGATSCRGCRPTSTSGRSPISRCSSAPRSRACCARR